VSAASVATAKLLGPELPSASLFEGPPEESLPETYGCGVSDEADNETMDESIMDVANDIFEEEKEDDGTEVEDPWLSRLLESHLLLGMVSFYVHFL
jgi:hypothetical protein